MNWKLPTVAIALTSALLTGCATAASPVDTAALEQPGIMELAQATKAYVEEDPQIVFDFVEAALEHCAPDDTGRQWEILTPLYADGEVGGAESPLQCAFPDRGKEPASVSYGDFEIEGAVSIRDTGSDAGNVIVLVHANVETTHTDSTVRTELKAVQVDITPSAADGRPETMAVSNISVAYG